MQRLDVARPNGAKHAGLPAFFLKNEAPWRKFFIK